MPRYFHGGATAVDPEIYASHATDKDMKDRLRKEATEHHPLGGPHRNSVKKLGDRLVVKRPLMFCPRDHLGKPIETYDDFQPGSITLGLVGVGFFVVVPGGHIDIDPSVSEDTVKANAPHLLTESEAMGRGLLEPPPTLKKQPKVEQKGSQT